jgi:hypothetical protein
VRGVRGAGRAQGDLGTDVPMDGVHDAIMCA